MIEETKERRRLTRAELEIRPGRSNEMAMTDHERAQKAFYDNRARLKAEWLVRETELKAKVNDARPAS